MRHLPHDLASFDEAVVTTALAMLDLTDAPPMQRLVRQACKDLLAGDYHLRHHRDGTYVFPASRPPEGQIEVNVLTELFFAAFTSVNDAMSV